MNDTPPPTDLDAIIAIPPMEEPKSEVAQLDHELHIRVPGQPKRQLPAPLVVGLMIFGFSAFICPGVFLVAVVLLPFVLLGLGITYLVSPQTFASPIGPQELWLSDHRITLSSSPALPKNDDDDDEASQSVVEPTLTSISLDDIDSVTLVTDAAPGDAGIIITDNQGKAHIFGGALLPPASPLTEDIGDPRELEWLYDILQARLRHRLPP